MTRDLSRWSGMLWSIGAVLAIGILAVAAPQAHAQNAAQPKPAQQVTMFGVVATPRSTYIDPKLASVAPQLRKLLPNYGFVLKDVRSKRLTANQSLKCDLGGGYVASTTLIDPLDEDGKVQLKCALSLNNAQVFSTDVATPQNQLFFCDKALADGKRVLIGIGAR
jgi:hypothetical protein